MTRNDERIIKSTQEQAVASWITYLNQIRLNELIAQLNQQDINLEKALEELADLKEFIGNPAHILGSEATKHGEIAEHVQVNFSNARNLIKGLEKEYTFEGVGRTAPEDYIKNGAQVQSKFYNGSKNTLLAIQKHLKTYPDFVKNGGSYDIPKDQYEEMLRVINMSKASPSQLSKSDWKLVEAAKAFEESTGLDLTRDVNPTVANYADVQAGAVDKTIRNEEGNLLEEDKKQRNKAYKESKPSIREGTKTASISAAIEGSIAFCMAIAQKRKEGKKISEFTGEDWQEIGLESGKGALKGGIRGGAIYAITNFTATPANVASAYVTAAFGVAAQLKAYENNMITKEDFVINCEVVCLDVTVSAIASLVGQTVIPIPVLGAIIGNVAGEFIYELCKNKANRDEMEVISKHRNEIENLNQQLDIQYLKVVLEIQKALKRFTDLEKMAFDSDINEAFSSSVQLALELNVDEGLILKSKSDVDLYFLS